MQVAAAKALQGVAEKVVIPRVQRILRDAQPGDLLPVNWTERLSDSLTHTLIRFDSNQAVVQVSTNTDGINSWVDGYGAPVEFGTHGRPVGESEEANIVQWVEDKFSFGEDQDPYAILTSIIDKIETVGSDEHPYMGRLFDKTSPWNLTDEYMREFVKEFKAAF